MPGARAKGYLATNAIINVPTPAETAVATTNSVNKSCGSFKNIASDKINGLTTRIYAIVIKVVTPAKISVRKLVL